ncbi:uncharacterized protein LOC110449703 isoform X3 [Mizuhopecten yessoensis]|uniref:uncharacterized protein LOC110449703 isoform X3 n=1 Tax=Mizuhopecten yessoensis TaxID=6573 RepID=UPI000B459AC4|nr:uncharacterized protein LOC110449703 isoform X3 [Mizuhopecten yessoensis]
MPGSRSGSRLEDYTVYGPGHSGGYDVYYSVPRVTFKLEEDLRYPSDAYEAEYLPRDGALTPGMDRYGARTPSRGRESPLRRANSQMYRPVSRSASRQEFGTQIHRQPDPQQDYRNKAYAMYTPGPCPRPPPIERGATFAGFGAEDMDPFTKQYYNRLWKSRVPSTNINLNRMGRAGGRWRHVESCVANTGSNLTFIEGTVKQVDNVMTDPMTVSNPTMLPRYGQSRPLGRAPSPNRKNSKDTAFNHKAKNGFKYWYQEQKPIDRNLGRDHDETLWDSLVRSKQKSWHPVFA